MAQKKKLNASAVVPIVEEQTRIDKRQRPAGQVRVRTVTETLKEFTSGSLEERSVEVQRVPINRDVDEAPQIRRSGDLLIVPVLEEVLVIEKRLRLREELHIRQLTKTRRVKVPVERRVQRVIVESAKDDDAES